jgi:hypothetical protein
VSCAGVILRSSRFAGPQVPSAVPRFSLGGLRFAGRAHERADLRFDLLGAPAAPVRLPRRRPGARTMSFSWSAAVRSSASAAVTAAR